MRLKRSTVRARVCTLVSFVVLSATALTAAPALALPEGRVYEMVSPPYKADYGVEDNSLALGAAPDGESFVFRSFGAFGDARANTLTVPYIARRTPDGWVTSSTNPPPADGRLPGFNGDYTPDLSRQVTPVSAQKGGVVSSEGTAALILSDLRAPEISFMQAWPLPDGPATFPGDPGEPGTYIGASADLSHVVFASPFGGIYQILGVGGPEPKKEPVAVVGEPDGPGGAVLPECPGLSLKKIVELEGRFHAISDDGSEIFFSQCGIFSPRVPYVRVNGSTTFELSPAGEFQGASRDGSKAFFTNGTSELFMDMIDSEPGHEAVSETVPITLGAPASVVVSSDDGSHVYFTSSSVLAGANPQGSPPGAGVSNLYMYDSVTRKTAFIAVTEVDKIGEHYQAQTTPDGRFLAFTTDSRLTPDDTDTAASVYRYDAQTRALVRVSVGENGHDDNGNDNAFGASMAAPLLSGKTGKQDLAVETWRLGTRAISDDGSTIVFSTAAPFSSRAVNGNVNVYVWHEGRVGMISTGLSKMSDESPAVSQSGRDVFFLTSQGILPQDSDGLLDVYDARIGGGFPESPVPAGGCSGDACQGPPSVPSLLGAPASATFSGLGNPVAPTSKPAVKAMQKPKPKCKSGYKRNTHGKCVKVKKRARKAAAVPGRGHRSSRGGRS
jgi:Tol biopolymer transport system component